MSQIVLFLLQSTPVFSCYIDVVLTLSIGSISHSLFLEATSHNIMICRDAIKRPQFEHIRHRFRASLVLYRTTVLLKVLYWHYYVTPISNICFQTLWSRLCIHTSIFSKPYREKIALCSSKLWDIEMFLWSTCEIIQGSVAVACVVYPFLCVAFKYLVLRNATLKYLIVGYIENHCDCYGLASGLIFAHIIKIITAISVLLHL